MKNFVQKRVRPIVGIMIGGVASLSLMVSLQALAASGQKGEVPQAQEVGKIQIGVLAYGKAAIDLAIQEVNRSGLLLDGTQVHSLEADAGCNDEKQAVTSAQYLVDQGIQGIIGGDCSGTSIAILEHVARPHGLVMISPSSTSPVLSTMEDEGLFFRTAPSDARRGQVMADILLEKGIKSVALTYGDNVYGSGLAESFQKHYLGSGGTVTLVAPYKEGMEDYSQPVSDLAQAGGELLVVVGYEEDTQRIMETSINLKAFNTFFLPEADELYLQKLVSQLDGSFGIDVRHDSPGALRFLNMMATHAVYFENIGYAAESYDAAALMLLAMQAAGSADPSKFKEKVWEVANAPGEKILPGELAKALRILKEGGDIDYVGGSAVELVGSGEAKGNYRLFEVKEGKVIYP